MTLKLFKSNQRHLLLKIYLIAIFSFGVNNCTSTKGDTQAEAQKQIFIESISGDRMYMLRYEPAGPLIENQKGVTGELDAPSS